MTAELHRKARFVYSRRTVMAGAAMALLAPARSAVAATWPDRTVTTLVPYAPGGVSDLLARLAGQALGERLKQPFITVDREGGSGVVATADLARSAPDGYTLLFCTPAQVVTVPLLQDVPYDPATLTPISNLANYPLLLGIKASLPVKALDDFVSYARGVPGKLNYSSAGTGTISHLAGALFCARSGIDVTHIPYRGAAPAMAALLAGEVDMFFGSTSDLVPHLADARIRVIATSGEKPFAMIPGLPRVNERYPGFVLEPWNGYIGPPGMPADLVEQIANAVIEVSKQPQVLQRMRTQAIFSVGSSPAEFAKTLAQDRVFYAEAIKAAKIPRRA